MQFFKSILSLSAILAIASALVLEPKGQDTGSMTVLLPIEAVTSSRPATTLSTECEKDDEADCTEFCKLAGQTATCAAKGNKVTCYCKGGKGGESNCEERCLLCMPDKSALTEAKTLFKKGGSKMEL